MGHASQLREMIMPGRLSPTPLGKSFSEFGGALRDHRDKIYRRWKGVDRLDVRLHRVRDAVVDRLVEICCKYPIKVLVESNWVISNAVNVYLTKSRAGIAPQLPPLATKSRGAVIGAFGIGPRNYTLNTLLSSKEDSALRWLWFPVGSA
jgi:hypothetical protein